MIHGETYTLGRSPECDIVLDHVSVSRRHASIELANGAWVQDQGSRNGTHVTGRSLSAYERVHIGVGSVVQLGLASIILQHGIEPEVTSPESYQAASASSLSSSESDEARARIVVDPAMRKLYEMLEIVAPTTLSVLILGETGVGKEVYAHALHRRSLRAAGPFVRLNCAALTESLLEAELFGYEKGAFTGAAKAKAGLLETAHGGTLFLDEIGDTPIGTQVKLLRFLEDREVRRVGGTVPRRIDVRLVAATNRNLKTAVAKGSFRTDLYYRLNGVTVTIPPLHERRADIALLAATFASTASARLGRPTPSFSADALAYLERLPWQGNVRELRSVVERAIVFSSSAEPRELKAEDFINSSTPEPETAPDIGPQNVFSEQDEHTSEFLIVGSAARTIASGRQPSDGKNNLEREVREFERTRIVAALDASQGNQSEAARRLGISRAVLRNRLKHLGLLQGFVSSRSK